MTRTRFHPTDDYYNALKLIMNAEFDEAQKLIDVRKDWDPISIVLQAELFNIKSFISQIRQDREKFVENVSSAGDNVNQMLKDEKKFNEYVKKVLQKDDITEEEKFNYRVMLELTAADCLLFKAMGQVHMNSYIKAAWNMKKAWNGYCSLMNKHMKDDKTDLHEELAQCLKFGLGVFYYIVSMLPSMVQSILGFIGFVSDYERGLKYLHEVYSGESLRAPYAAMMFTMNYLFMPSALTDYKENLKKAEPIVDFLKKNYPNGPISNYMVSQYQRKCGNAELAIQSLENGIKIFEKMGVVPYLYLFDLSGCYAMDLNWKAAIEVLEKMVEKDVNKDFEFLAMGVVLLGCCYILEGQKEKGIKTLESVKDYVHKKAKFDELALKISKHILNAKDLMVAVYGSTFEFLYYKRDIAHMKEEKLKELQSKMMKVKETMDPKKDVAASVSFMLIEGAIYRGLQLPEKAKEVFLKALEHEPKCSKEIYHIMVGVNYEMAELMVQEKKYEEAERYLKQANKYSKYDFEELQKARLGKALKQIKEMINREKK